MAPTGRSRGAIISQYYNRTVKLRRRASRPELKAASRSARPSLRLYDLEMDPMVLEEEGEWQGWSLSGQEVRLARTGVGVQGAV